jgi:patatin-like phospholipase/acyl hydrolase
MFILSLEGGGEKGLFTAVLLDRLNKACPTFLPKIDLFAGTSTGGILALGLASDMSTDDLIKLYLDNAIKIFNAPLKRKLQTLWGLLAPKYSNEGLREVLTDVFGNAQIQDLKHDVLITSYDCGWNSPINFTKLDAYKTIVEVALCTSAAEVFFPPYQNFIDGGTTANDPSIAAISWVVSQGTKLEDIKVLSIGTGNLKPPALDPTPRWGAIQWLKGGLIDILISGVSERVRLDASNILGNRFFYLDGTVNCAMDATSNLEEKLIQPAQQIKLDDVIRWIEK